ncbi:non-lysosomal glucosylceramidase [soil metagenome]
MAGAEKMKAQNEGTRFTRRGVLRTLAAIPLATSLGNPQTVPTRPLIPADKRLAPDWVRGLTERGEPEIFRGDELRYVGMPVGGICCGQLYLGGDGRLWLWDVFKSNHSRMSYDGSFDRMEQCGHYIKPVEQGAEYTPDNGAKVEQGFRLRVNSETARTLDRAGFPEVEFRGEYPIGRVTYVDPSAPVQTSLEAFSPFIPLDADDSGLPVTILAFTLRNVSSERATVTLEGWLQNAVCPSEASVQRKNALVLDGKLGTALLSASGDFRDKPGFGTMALSVRVPEGAVLLGEADFGSDRDLSVFQEGSEASGARMGGLGVRLEMDAEETRTVEFLVSWFFPDYAPGGEMGAVEGFPNLRRHYAGRFDGALAVARYVHLHFDRLALGTRLWSRTWYDSTLPYWFLDRTFIPTDCLATQTCHRFDNGRFWGWEGVDCCPGTCQHVWNYAQAMARIFPEIERDLRERVDLGLALHPEGGMGHRAECGPSTFTDGHAGTILRTYREHTLSRDRGFLERIWPNVKPAVEFLIRQDKDRDGILEGEQENTLDAAWYGPMAWVSSLYLAALRCAAEMADERGDGAFASECRATADRGRDALVRRLYNGEYFIHLPPDFKHINSNRGCHIDQVLGQSWAWQVGIDRVVPQRETVSALRALWKYNFAPDAGGYAIEHTAIKGHRIYAEQGEAGLVMTTWPHGGAENAVPGTEGLVETFDRYLGPGGYFDECMTGFEYQAAAHMIYEGEPGSDLVRNGLAAVRAIHDRYAPAKRNPYNEIECSDHYARAMAAYGVFLAACGFRYHGPKGELSFAPKVGPEDFRAAFTTAEGWGAYAQSRSPERLSATLAVLHGRLELTKLSLELADGHQASSVELRTGERRLPGRMIQAGTAVSVLFDAPLALTAPEEIRVTVS